VVDDDDVSESEKWQIHTLRRNISAYRVCREKNKSVYDTI